MDSLATARVYGRLLFLYSLATVERYERHSSLLLALFSWFISSPSFPPSLIRTLLARKRPKGLSFPSYLHISSSRSETFTNNCSFATQILGQKFLSITTLQDRNDSSPSYLWPFDSRLKTLFLRLYPRTSYSLSGTFTNKLFLQSYSLLRFSLDNSFSSVVSPFLRFSLKTSFRDRKSVV